MSTQPRMRAPIARVRIETREGRKKRRSGTSRRPAPVHSTAEVSETEEAAASGDQPRFYPFALRRVDDTED